MKTKKITLCAILVALALLLSLLERLIPLSYLFPLPGVKLGLSNLVTLFALYCLGLPYAFTVLILRCVLGSIFGGSLTSLAYSLSGGILSLCISYLAKGTRFFSVYGVSILGSAAHSIGQILAASLLLGSMSAFGYLPVLLFVSILTGFLIGSLGALLIKNLSGILSLPSSGKEACRP